MSPIQEICVVTSGISGVHGTAPLTETMESFYPLLSATVPFASGDVEVSFRDDT